MYQTWYRALVNGAPGQVRESPLGLVMVGVPAGESRVVLTFEAPFGLKAAFYLSLAAAFGWVAWVIQRFARAVPGLLDSEAE